MTERRPSVLLIITDELRERSLGYAGDPNARTPRIDALAAESIRYREAVSGMPVCCPARASFLTGQYPLQHGVYINDVPLRPTGPVLPREFASHGYRTGYIGKWHLFGSPEGRFERREAFIPDEERFGFEYWRVGECTHDYNHSAYYAGDDPEKRYWEGYDAIAQTDDALGFVAAADDPYFLVVSYGPPHFPLHTAPDRFRELYADADISVPANVPEEFADDARHDLRGYYAHIAAIDECVGRLLDGIAPDTIVVFTADHGDMLWSQGIDHKLVPWEESVRVPFLVRAPERAADVVGDLFNSPDLMPTLLGFAGLPVPEGLMGEDLSAPGNGPGSALLGAPVSYSTLRRTGFAEYRGVRDSRYTYVRTRTGPWLLYDNVADPDQLRNLCGDPSYAAELQRLDGAVDGWLARLGDEFLDGGAYLARDGLEHYFEAHEPIGSASTDQWRATHSRAWRYSIDTQLSRLLADPDARALVEDLASPLLEDPHPLLARRSIRLLAMASPGLLPPSALAELDARLLALPERSPSPRNDVSEMAWPPPVRLTPPAVPAPGVA